MSFYFYYYCHWKLYVLFVYFMSEHYYHLVCMNVYISDDLISDSSILVDH
jgi:hypothetical protein